MTFYWSAIVSIALSCIISKIKQDIGRKSRFILLPSIQRPHGTGNWVVATATGWRPSVADWAMVYLLAAPWVQLSVSAGNGWPHLRHHWLMPISCHFRDCKALLVTSLTHVSGAIANVQTFTFTFKTTTYVHKLYWCPSISSWIIPGCVASQYENWTCCEPPQQAEVYSACVTVQWNRQRQIDYNYIWMVLVLRATIPDQLLLLSCRKRIAAIESHRLMYINREISFDNFFIVDSSV